MLESANFREPPHREVPGTFLPRTPVNKPVYSPKHALATAGSYKNHLFDRCDDKHKFLPCARTVGGCATVQDQQGGRAHEARHEARERTPRKPPAPPRGPLSDGGGRVGGHPCGHRRGSGKGDGLGRNLPCPCGGDTRRGGLGIRPGAAGGAARTTTTVMPTTSGTIVSRPIPENFPSTHSGG